MLFIIPVHRNYGEKCIKKINEFQQCPVCYETIEPDALIVPNCTHMICDTCVRKCDNCPLCRDKYDEFIEID